MANNALDERDVLTRPACEVSQEVRFAVVMYGGVSLAVYINGVTQELFELVRATAAETDTATAAFAASQLTGAGRVYRRLGQFLGGNQAKLTEISETHPILSRFVIDVISGTSAGGINGIALAKALANDQQIRQLKQLWIDEGDIAGLINDKKSVDALPLTVQEPPQSLLNGQRMYLKLFRAFDDMEQRSAKPISPYVDELDLFVTTTDLEGLTLPLRLADRVVFERRHRNVFHFLYATEEASGEYRNDFTAPNNPFLAFAARCTSAFPFAFEPMRLADLALVPPYEGNAEALAADSKRWQCFFSDYALADFSSRSFGDGGYLDNKPFSYATETLLRRRADTRTLRKLIYIEPSPEHPEREARHAAKYDVIENTLKALVTLPGYETIREDIQRVLERNRLIERVGRIISRLEKDIADGNLRSGSEPTTEWVKRDLAALIEQKGVSYGGYHRLKIAALTDELAALITAIAGFNEESDEFVAVRYLVRVWRETEYVENYGESSPDAAPRPTQNQLLLDLDLSYRFRRLNFLRGKIDELYPLDTHAEEVIRCLERSLQTTILPLKDQAAFRNQLLSIKHALGRILVELRRVRRDLRAGKDRGSRLRQLITDTGLTPEDLKKLLNQPTDEHRRYYAEGLMGEGDRLERFRAVAQELTRQLRPALLRAAEASEVLFRADPRSSEATNAARRCLSHYYRCFNDYDLITFPILYGTGVGESEVVEMIRISPEDATALIDEEGGKHPKLAGVTLFHFGAFLERLWRQNDMLWGRLDGAERLITALLPEHPEEARQLIGEAQRAILIEELPPQELDAAYRTVVNAIRQLCGGELSDAEARELIKQVADLSISDKLKAFLDACLGRAAEVQRPTLQTDIVAREPNPETTLRSLARATTVVGKMLAGLGARYPTGSFGSWLTRFGQVFWGIVEVAVPRSFDNLLFRYWLQLLYLFETFLIAGGLLFGVNTVQNFGLMTFGVTLALHTAVSILGAYMRGRHGVLRVTLTIAVTSIIVLAILGVVEVGHLMDSAREWLATARSANPK